jgi:uncharacterized membrane protein YgcG
MDGQDSGLRLSLLVGLQATTRRSWRARSRSRRTARASSSRKTLAPLWVVLTVSGAALVVVALAIERALRRAPHGEISGFTADPLFSDEPRQQALQIVAVVATFTAPAARSSVEEKGFAGGGGQFGGGGASEKF